MSDYSKAKIYKLVIDEDPSLVYYGSTVQPLCERLSNHKQDFVKNNRGTTSKKLFETGYKVKIVLVENFPCASKEELRAREEWWRVNNKCVNVMSNEPWNEEKDKASKRKHYEAHKDEILERNKQRYENKKPEIREKAKKHREEHKEEIAQARSAKWFANKEELSKKRNQKFDCDCGGSFSYANRAKHVNTPKHQEWLKSQQSEGN